MNTTTQPDVSALSFEQAVEEREKIVAALERGDVPLDRSIEIYERGEALKKHCETLLSAAEIYVSARAACAGGERKPSHVLTAMGLSATQASETLRFSSGFGSKLSDADETSNAIDFAIRNHF